MTDVVTEMPPSRSTFIHSLAPRRRAPRALTRPPSWIAPPNKSSFSVNVVLPASGCAMIAKVRRFAICVGSSGVGMTGQFTEPPRRAQPDMLPVHGAAVREQDHVRRDRRARGALLARRHDRRTNF